VITVKLKKYEMVDESFDENDRKPDIRRNVWFIWTPPSKRNAYADKPMTMLFVCLDQVVIVCLDRQGKSVNFVIYRQSDCSRLRKTTYNSPSIR
jgi:hypothetical protein